MTNDIKNVGRGLTTPFLHYDDSPVILSGRSVGKSVSSSILLKRNISGLINRFSYYAAMHNELNINSKCTKPISYKRRKKLIKYLERHLGIKKNQDKIVPNPDTFDSDYLKDLYSD